METTILEQVAAAREAVDFSVFTARDVECALDKQTITPVDLAGPALSRGRTVSGSRWHSGRKR